MSRRPGEAAAHEHDLREVDERLAGGGQRLSNRQKADQDVAEWLPEESVRCKYLTYWVPAKPSWSLSVDQAELQALDSLADGCPDTDITSTPVP